MSEQCPRYESCPAPRLIRDLGLKPEDQYSLMDVARRTLVLGGCSGYNPNTPDQCNNDRNKDGEVTTSLVGLGKRLAEVRLDIAKLLQPVLAEERAIAEAERLAEQNETSI